MAVPAIRSLRSGVLAVLAVGALAMLVPATMAMQSALLVKSGHGNLPRPALRDCDNKVLVGSVVHPGQCIVVLAPGFAAAEQVQARTLSKAAHTSITRADAHGVVHYRLQVPRGSAITFDVLTLVGLGSGSPEPAAGNVSVSVPRYAVVRYQIRRN